MPLAVTMAPAGAGALVLLLATCSSISAGLASWVECMMLQQEGGSCTTCSLLFAVG